MSFTARLFPETAHQSLAAGERIPEFLFFLLRLLAVFGVLYLYDIEATNGLKILLPFFATAALINFWLPHRLRAAFLVLVSWGTIVFALGFVSGLTAIGLVLLFIGVAHLPVKHGWRVAVSLLLAAGLAMLRHQEFYLPRMIIAMPVCGTFLMFRYMIYLFERRYETSPGPGIWQRLSYFFIPFNLAFPLFPIVDYKTWLRTHYNENPARIYKEGFRRLAFGIVYLLLYRCIYLLVPNPATLHDAGELAVFIILGYALILRILGMFGIAAGLMGIFGYNLPPLFDNVFLLSGFAEIWRRINIYWRDFITKVFYFPFYFRIRKKTKHAVLISTIVVFIMTWLLHGWQWFWLRGDFGFKTTDTVYWLLLGFFITIGLMREHAAQGAKPRANVVSFRSSFVYMLRVSGMYLFMSILWTMWNSATLHEWFFLLSRGLTPSSGWLAQFGSSVTVQWLMLLLIALLVVAAAALVHFFWVSNQFGNVYSRFKNASLLPLVISVLLLLPAIPQTQKFIPGAETFAAEFQHPQLSRHDRENAEQGYYEKIIDQSGGHSPWEVHILKPSITEGLDKITRTTDNILQRELIPSAESKVRGIYTLHTNAFGMRDKAYTEAKPKNVFRILLLGSSYEMGVGVNDGETFESIAEQWINDSLQKAGDSLRIEILNAAVGGYHLPQQLFLAQKLVPQFKPDMILLAAHSEDPRRLNGFFSSLIQNGVDLHYPYLQDVKTKSGARQWMSRDEIRNRLQAYNDSVIQWAYSEICRCGNSTVQKAWLYLPATADQVQQNEFDRMQAYATNAGFQLLADFRDVYGQNPRSSLQVNSDDTHPNAEGHRLIARDLELTLQQWLPRMRQSAQY